MSDIYLVLRSRLEAVADANRREWVDVGTRVMQAARKRRGLSYEAVSRLTHTSSKTYERYEKAGRLPAAQIDLYAEVLGLEIDRPVFEPSRVAVPVSRDELSEVLRGILERLDRIEEALADPSRVRSVGGDRRSVGGWTQ